MLKKTLLLLNLALLSTCSQAQTITNLITGIGPRSALINPYFCIQDANGQMTYALTSGKSVDGNKYSGDPKYIGGALRFGGCSSQNTYLGYVGISGTNIKYSPPNGIHILYTNPNIDSSGNMTGEIHYSAIAPNFDFQIPVTRNNNWQFVGANLSGLEFGKVPDPFVIPNLSKEDANSNLSDLADTESLIKSGMNTMRIPLDWGYLQLNGPGTGEINLDYFNSYVKPLIETLTSAQIYTIVDLHAYMRYSQFGKEYAGCGIEGHCPDGTLVTDPNKYINVWTKLYALLKNDPKININYILLDLVNEPVNAPNDSVFTIQAKVIQSLRSQGYQGYILVEGNNWSGLHSWTTATWQTDDGQVLTNASLFTRENFAKAGITDLSKIIINVHQYLDSDYSGTHDQCLTDLSTTGADGFNLNAFTDYLQHNNLQAMVTEFGAGKDSATCSIAMSQFLNYLQTNAAQNKNYGFIGWTIWSTGHGWGNYNLRVTPGSYQMQTLKSYL